MSRQKVKRQLLDELDAKHKFAAPPSLVEDEFTNVWKTIVDDLQTRKRTFEEEGTTEDKAKEEYRGIAERRVRLGLVLAEIGRANNVQVTDQELSEAMRQEAMKYGPQAQQIFELFRQNPNAQAQMRAPIFEDKVVDLIVGKAKVKDRKVSKDDLMKDDELPEGYDA